MSFIKVSNGRIIGLVLLSVVSGIASFLFIVQINRIIGRVINLGISSNENLNNSLIILGITLVYAISRRLLILGIIDLSETTYWGNRLEVIQDLVNTSYLCVKKIKAKLYSTFTHDINQIKQASLYLIDMITSLILILVCFIYLAYLSMPLFLVSLVVIIFGIVFHFFLSKKGEANFQKTRELENDFIHNYNAILDGIKEINLQKDIGKEIYERKIVKIAEEAKRRNKRAYIGFFDGELLGRILFFLLVAFILIYSSEVFKLKPEIIISFVLTLLYILQPITSVMVALPIMSNALISIRHMSDIKSQVNDNPNYGKEVISFDKLKFEQIKYNDIYFSYGIKKFTIGPINLCLKQRCIYFIYGGNGSGKTTLLNTLLTLFNPVEGSIRLNNKLLEPSEIKEIRSLFSVVFSDYYLFDEFYGNANFNKAKAKAYLKLFEIEQKVSITDRGFSRIDMSTGQRKRLALISSILENRPILVLDEWAADQDPSFRKKFYQEILPFIKEEGFTILVITHDDHYYHCADVLYKMEYGQLIEKNLK